MTDELNVWREAVMTQFGCTSDKKPDAAAAVIRDYGDKRDATARSEGHAKGYQQAIADVVEWLGDEFPHDIAIRAKITRRFGKGQT